MKSPIESRHGEWAIGDRVTWTSQSAGTVKTKTGAIVEIVPRGFRPADIHNAGLQRDHDSYVVRADNGRLYWPRVTHLRKAFLDGAERERELP